MKASSNDKPAFQAETGHWYKGDGSPCYQVASANGNMRGTTLADARKLSLRPSVTTVTNIVAKPALISWLIDEAIKACVRLPKGPRTEAEYIRDIRIESRRGSKEAAEEGDRIHNACEAHYRGRPFDDEYGRHVRAVAEEVSKLFPGVNDWIAEKSFSCSQGFGGKVDLHSPSTGIVIDFKTKDGDFSDGKKLAYDQDVQLSAYSRGLGLPANKCANIFVSRTHPGKVASHVWAEEQIARAWEEFKCILALWKAKNRYDPSV